MKNGEMTLSELKRLVKKYDELMSLNVKGMKRPELLEAIDQAGYDVNHKKMTLELKKAKMKRLPTTIKMPPKPKPKSEADKKKAKDKKRESVIQYIIKNKDVLEDERIKTL